MGNPRKPTNVLDINGRLKHDKKRFERQGRFNEPVDERPLGDAPVLQLLTLEEAWNAIVEQCPAGVLRRRDRVAVTQAATLLQETHNHRVMCFWDQELAINSNAYLKAMAQLSSAMSKLGMNPVDASRVSATPAAKPKNDFDD